MYCVCVYLYRGEIIGGYPAKHRNKNEEEKKAEPEIGCHLNNFFLLPYTVKSPTTKTPPPPQTLICSREPISFYYTHVYLINCISSL